MLEIVSIVLSIFGLIGIGYAAARTRLLKPETGDGLADFVFTIPIPVLLFRTLATADFQDLSPWAIWASYFSAAAIVWAAAHLMIRRLFGRDTRAGVVAGISSVFANIVLVGLPLVQITLGESGLAAALVLLSIHLPVMMAAGVILNEWAVRADGLVTAPVDAMAAVRGFVGPLLRNPIIIGIAAGLVWRASGLTISGPPALIVDALAQVAGPVALVACGLSLARYGVSGNVRPALAITALKLAALPAAVLAVGMALGLAPVALAAVTLVAACPTGVNAFLIASRLGTGQALSSNAMTISTAAGVVTVALWLAVVRALLI
jgi:malonate transporter and related proteins